MARPDRLFIADPAPFSAHSESSRDAPAWSFRLRTFTVFFVALAVRLYVLDVFILPDYLPVGDAAEYVTIAKNLTAGHGFSIRGGDTILRPTARRSPLFPFVLSACFALFGDGYEAPFFMLSIAGAGTCVIISHLASRLFGQREAWLAGVAAAMTPGLWINGTTLMTEGIYLLLLVALVLYADRMRDSDSRAWIPVGILAGLLALTRAEGLMLWGVLCGWIIAAPSIEHRWRSLVCTLALAILVVLPWAVRNFLVFGAFVPGSTVSGFVFAGANNPAIYDRPGATGGWTAEFVYDPRYAACTADPHATEPAYTACWKRQALLYALENKQRWPSLIVWRLRRALDLWPPQLSAFFEQAEGRVPTLTIAAAVAFYPTMLLGILGALVSIRRFLSLFWLYAIPAFYLAEIAMTWGVQRLRAPIEPFLLLFAAFFCVAIVLRTRASRSHS